MPSLYLCNAFSHISHVTKKDRVVIFLLSLNLILNGWQLFHFNGFFHFHLTVT